MRDAAKAIWRFLSHPVLQVGGNIYTLVSVVPVIGALLSVLLGVVLRQPLIFWLAIALCLVTIVLLFVTRRPARATETDNPATVDGAAGVLRIEVDALDTLRAQSESVLEIRFKNSTESDFTNVAVNVDVPQGFQIRRSTQDGRDRPGGTVMTSGDRRFWQGILNPLRGFGTTTVEHFAVVPAAAGDFDLILKVQLEGSDWKALSWAFSAGPNGPEKRSNTSTQGAAHDLADFYKEGDDLRRACRPPELASAVQKLMWSLGGNPEQIELEKKARAWDQAVSEYLWSRQQLKVLGPGWKEAGDPPPKAALVDQSHTGPATLEKWYDAKLLALAQIIQKVS